MFEKIRYILFDFSEGFKNDFIAMFKKTVFFLVMAAICLPLSDVNEFFSLVGGFGMVAFGFMWGRSFVDSVLSFGNAINNFIFKLFWIILIFAISLVLGFAYFIWCVFKYIICLMKSKPQVSTKPINSRQISGFTTTLNNIHAGYYSESELDAMHSKLLQYASQCVSSRFRMDEDGNLCSNNQADISNTQLPPGVNLYGCVTYGDAEFLNAEIVKILDKM